MVDAWTGWVYATVRVWKACDHRGTAELLLGSLMAVLILAVFSLIARGKYVTERTTEFTLLEKTVLAMVQSKENYWPIADVETTRVTPMPNSTTIRPAHAIRPVVPNL